MYVPKKWIKLRVRKGLKSYVRRLLFLCMTIILNSKLDCLRKQLTFRNATTGFTVKWKFHTDIISITLFVDFLALVFVMFKVFCIRWLILFSAVPSSGYFMSLDTSVLSDGPNSKRYTHSVNSLKDGHLWEWNLVFIFERILTESQIKGVNKCRDQV